MTTQVKPRAGRKPRRSPTPKTRQFLVDEKGEAMAVVLPLEEYEALIEALEQADDIRHLQRAKAVRGKSISLQELEARLRAKGKLP